MCRNEFSRNADLERIVETSDDWITTRTGIKERRIAGENEHTSHMAARAAENAMEQAGVAAPEIDLDHRGNGHARHVLSSTACHVQRHLGAINAACFDVSAACSGFSLRNRSRAAIHQQSHLQYRLW